MGELTKHECMFKYAAKIVSNQRNKISVLESKLKEWE